MNIEISLQNASLKASSLQDNHVTAIIHGFFGALQVTPASTVTSNQTEKIAEAVVQSNIAEAVTKALGALKPDTKLVSQHTEDSDPGQEPKYKRVLPKINAARTLQVPIGDVAKIKTMESESQSHWETGIKIEEDGTERLRCYYWCDCGSKGKRYIQKNTEKVNCRDCGQELFVEPATPNYQENGLPERDSFGNFYIAREPWEIGDSE